VTECCEHFSGQAARAAPATLLRPGSMRHAHMAHGLAIRLAPGNLPLTVNGTLLCGPDRTLRRWTFIQRVLETRRAGTFVRRSKWERLARSTGTITPFSGTARQNLMWTFTQKGLTNPPLTAALTASRSARARSPAWDRMRSCGLARLGVLWTCIPQGSTLRMRMLPTECTKPDEGTLKAASSTPLLGLARPRVRWTCICSCPVAASTPAVRLGLGAWIQQATLSARRQ